MKHLTKLGVGRSVCLTLAVFALVVPAYSADHSNTDHSSSEVNSVADMIQKGRAYVNFRYRYEHVDQDGISSNAKASTLRSRLGYETAEYMGFQALLEAEDVQAIGSDEYNSTVNGRTTFPVVADPEGTEVNQAYLTYSGVPDTKVLGGRHALKLDNLRFVGDVGWRQNNQTHDGVTLTNASIEDLRLFYGYSASINRIFGEDSGMGEFDSNVHLFNIHYGGWDIADLTAYAYLMDFDEAPGASTSTFGGRVDGSHDLSDDLTLGYDLEYAFQQDYEDNPVSYDVNYYRVEPSLAMAGFTLAGGYELLGSDDGTASFSTPLATLHKWNGWADKFLSTPANGLIDFYGSLAYKVSGAHEWIDGLVLKAIFHDFSADEGSADYGTEWNFLAKKKIDDNYAVLVKYASYDAEDFATDTEKLMLQVTASFKQLLGS